MMNVLEKILEEIEREAMTNKEIGRKQCEGMARAMNIIRSHMNDIPDDGWIPVGERVPESKTHVLCCFENGAVDSLWQDWKESGFGGYFDDDFKPMEVVAWQPLPDPYKPKKDITAAGTEHVVSRFMTVE